VVAARLLVGAAALLLGGAGALRLVGAGALRLVGAGGVEPEAAWKASEEQLAFACVRC